MDAPVAAERRQSVRLGRSRHGIELARIRPGYTAQVLDASSGGVLVETPRRLLPGARVDLLLHRAGQRVCASGLVLRCAVSGLGPGSIYYRGAIRFERDLTCLCEPVRLEPPPGTRPECAPTTHERRDCIE